jgi:hypothetical protein
MRTFETTRDIIDLARRFHNEVSAFYERLGNQASKGRVRLLLQYMSRHEKHLEECLAEYELDASQRILETWFQYTPATTPVEHLQTIQLEPEMSIDDVVDLALRLDEYLVDLYREVANQADSREVAEVFGNLLNLEQQEEIAVTRNALSIQDL